MGKLSFPSFRRGWVYRPTLTSERQPDRFTGTLGWWKHLLGVVKRSGLLPPSWTKRTSRYRSDLGARWHVGRRLARLNVRKEKPAIDRVFTLEINGQPVVVFAPDSNSEVVQKEGRILETLKRLKSDGTPLWDARAPMNVRTARAKERSLYCQVAEEATDGPDDLVLAYLVELDEARDDQPVEPGAFPPGP